MKEKWSCKWCDSYFNEERNLKTHQKIYHDTKLRRFDCVHCKRKFTTAYNLVQHHKAAHKLLPLPGKKDYVCSYTRNTRAGLKHITIYTHAFVHYFCLCFFFLYKRSFFKSCFSSFYSVQDERKKKIEKPKLQRQPLPCPQCDQILKGTFNLNRHMKRTHMIQTGKISVIPQKCHWKKKMVQTYLQS